MGLSPCQGGSAGQGGDLQKVWGCGCKLSLTQGQHVPVPEHPRKGLAPLQPAGSHSHMDQVVGDSCLQPSPANLEGLDAQWG